MSQDTQADELLTSLGKEAMKVYRVYDGSSRVTEQYETYANTVNGGPALKTEYVYDGATTNVLKMKETISTWNSSWDI